MSAYVLETDKVEKLAAWLTSARTFSKHCAPLARLGYRNKFDDGWEELAVDLLAMNQDAVMQRYPDCDATDLPGPIAPRQVGTRRPMPYSDSEAFHVMRSYLYQCAEGDVYSSELYNAVQSVYHHLAVTMAEEYIKDRYPTANDWA